MAAVGLSTKYYVGMAGLVVGVFMLGGQRQRGGAGIGGRGLKGRDFVVLP